jgi:hypothetical protein
MVKKRPKGLVVFSVLIILSSLLHINTLYRYSDWYTGIYGYWPEWLIDLRYAFSWIQRIIGIMTAIGILFLNNLYRRIGILLGCFTIITIYWKHPYQAFLKSNMILDEQLGPLFEHIGLQDYLQSIGLAPLSFASYTVAAIVFHSLLDILFWFGFIYYFTRPEIKRIFINKT